MLIAFALSREKDVFVSLESTSAATRAGRVRATAITETSGLSMYLSL
jgi:hypothetical protein